jgi:hypothetical protein
MVNTGRTSLGKFGWRAKSLRPADGWQSNGYRARSLEGIITIVTLD